MYWMISYVYDNSETNIVNQLKWQKAGPYTGGVRGGLYEPPILKEEILFSL